MSDTPLTIEQRIATLERQNRRMRTWCGVMGVLAAAPMLLAAQRGSAPSDLVRTANLEIVRNGVTVAAMGSDAEGGNMFLFRPDRPEQVASITSNKEGGQLMLFQPGGVRSSSLLSFTTGGSLDIADKAGQTVGYFDAKPNGAYLQLKNSAHNEVARIYVNPSLAGVIQTWDQADKVSFRAP